MLLFFDSGSGKQVDFDFSGSLREIESRFSPDHLPNDALDAGASVASERKRCRPKLGVVGREVTLLPRHWEWLETQRGGASAALRRLVDQARKEMSAKELTRQSQDATQRFMTAIAGNLPGYEEAVRALYACDKARFEQETAGWPADIRQCSRKFAEFALQ